MDCLPEYFDVLVVGGGPAGSSCATLLAQQGIDVVLLEKVKHPREQVGESLIPHFWKYTDRLGVSSKIEQEQFVRKAGGITVWDDAIHQISFADFGFSRPALHVERAAFDNILLRHSQVSGAQIFECISVKRIDFSVAGKPVVHYLDRRQKQPRKGTIRCQYVVDATGHSALISSQMKTKQLVSSKLKFLSLWGYFKNARYFGADATSHAPSDLGKIDPVTFVLSYEDGWIWHIILREKTSVGLIIHTERTKGMTKKERQEFFLSTCRKVPYLKDLLSSAQFVQDSLQFRPDYSYYSTAPCGDSYYCIGDAATFVDPIYSHGVINAFYNAAVAAEAIKASLANASRRIRYSELCNSRLQQFYSFSRGLALGDTGGEGINLSLVKNLMRTVPSVELELMLAAASVSNRSENFRKLVNEAGISNHVDEKTVYGKTKNLSALIV